MTPAPRREERPAWTRFLLRVGLLGLALHATALAIVGASREPGVARAVIMVSLGCFVASVWAGLRPLTGPRNPARMVEALGTAVLATVFALLLGWSAAGG